MHEGNTSLVPNCGSRSSCVEGIWGACDRSRHSGVGDTNEACRLRVVEPNSRGARSAVGVVLHCASTRANYMLRVVRPELVQTLKAMSVKASWHRY